MHAASLRIPADSWDCLTRHLVRGDGRERLAFLPVGVRRTPGGTDLLAFDTWPVADADLVSGPEAWHLEPTPDALVSMINRAVRLGVGLVEVHNHPGSASAARFSLADEDGFAEVVPYALASLKIPLYGALVIDETGHVEGTAWYGSPEERRAVASVDVIGSRRTTIVTTAGRSEGCPWRAADLDGQAFDRQIRAFGTAGQLVISRLRVAVVGLGGIGAIVAQQLAHLGVRRFALIDPDGAEESNLNRLVGMTVDDISARPPKTSIAARLIRSLHPHAEIVEIRRPVFHADALAALAGCDLIVAGTDNAASRYAINEASLAYLTPYLDLGTEIFTADGSVTDIGGRMTFLFPGTGCLLCARAIDPFQAAAELRPPTAVQFDRQRGYVRGSTEPTPSVLPLNATIVSLAMNEVLAWATGWRPPARQRFFDGRDGSVCSVLFDRAADCVCCAELLGRGDLTGLFDKYRPWARHEEAA